MAKRYEERVKEDEGGGDNDGRRLCQCDSHRGSSSSPFSPTGTARSTKLLFSSLRPVLVTLFLLSLFFCAAEIMEMVNAVGAQTTASSARAGGGSGGRERSTLRRIASEPLLSSLPEQDSKPEGDVNDLPFGGLDRLSLSSGSAKSLDSADFERTQIVIWLDNEHFWQNKYNYEWLSDETRTIFKTNTRVTRVVAFCHGGTDYSLLDECLHDQVLSYKKLKIDDIGIVYAVANHRTLLTIISDWLWTALRDAPKKLTALRDVPKKLLLNCAHPTIDTFCRETRMPFVKVTEIAKISFPPTVGSIEYEWPTLKLMPLRQADSSKANAQIRLVTGCVQVRMRVFEGTTLRSTFQDALTLSCQAKDCKFTIAARKGILPESLEGWQRRNPSEVPFVDKMEVPQRVQIVTPETSKFWPTGSCEDEVNKPSSFSFFYMLSFNIELAGSIKYGVLDPRDLKMSSGKFLVECD